MKIPRCKGARDLMPQDMRRFRRIKEVFRSTCEAWGYDEVRTPTLEYLHLFTSAGMLTPEMLSRVYSFLDWDGWSGERVVLRPDGTIPIARLYVENMAGKSPARLYYVANMFSFEGTGKEDRERWQCGVELIGGAAPQGDAELIMLALDILEKLQISPINVKISHVGFSKALLEQFGYEGEDRVSRLREIVSGNTSFLSEIDGQPPEVERFLKMIQDLRGKSLGYLANLNAILPENLAHLRPYIHDLAQVAELLDSIGQDYQIDFTSGEGFEYYTGIVFQFYSYDKIVGNGGRYDELIRLVGGEDIPASGFALFADKLMPLLYDETLPIPERILLTSDPSNIKDVFEVAALLRSEGFGVKTSFLAAEEPDCRWEAALGKDNDDIAVSLRDMKSNRTWEALSVEQMVRILGEWM